MSYRVLRMIPGLRLNVIGAVVESVRGNVEWLIKTGAIEVVKEQTPAELEAAIATANAAVAPSPPVAVAASPRRARF